MSNRNSRFERKVTIVTGGAGGLGQAQKTRLARCGGLHAKARSAEIVGDHRGEAGVVVDDEQVRAHAQECSEAGAYPLVSACFTPGASPHADRGARRVRDAVRA